MTKTLKLYNVVPGMSCDYSVQVPQVHPNRFHVQFKFAFSTMKLRNSITQDWHGRVDGDAFRSGKCRVYAGGIGALSSYPAASRRY